MSNSFFTFKQFTINQDKCVFKVGTDGVILGAYASLEGATNILDVGTGTGLVALMAAQRSAANIYAIEPDKPSFLQALENISTSKWSNRIFVENTRLQDYCPCNLLFNKIISNPPFFTGSLKNPNSRLANARHNESLPFDELLGGVNRLLTQDGTFEVILPESEVNYFVDLARLYGLFPSRYLKITSSFQSKIIREIIRFQKTESCCVEEVLSIENGHRHCYTEEYKGLTKEFYL